jgi:uncharacterized surface protein with fasciclin (FAS1) repeats
VTSNRIRTSGVILVGLLAFAASACGSDSKSSATIAPAPADTTAASTTSLPPPTKSILELGKEAGTVSTMLGLLDTAGMTTTLEGTGPFTLIAPTDAAFKKMDPATLDKISKSPEVLKQLLQYHLIEGRVTTKDLTAGFIATVEGSQVTLGATSSLPTVNGLIVDKAGRATNGTILLVDSVLIPIDIKLP